MKNLVNVVKNWVHSFDSVSQWTDETWVYHQHANPFDWGNFFPDGRYVFHRSKEQIPPLEHELSLRVKTGQIKAFKYAINPYGDNANPAIVVYSTEKRREEIRKVLLELGVNDCEWNEGNPVTVGMLCAEARDLPTGV